MNDQAEILEYLQEHYLFKTLGQTAIESLASKFTLLKVQPQRIIYRAKSAANLFYIVVSGALVEEKSVIEGKPESFQILEADCFGFEAISPSPSSYASSLTVKSAAVLLAINTQAIAELSGKFPGIKQIFSLLLKSYHLQQTRKLSWRNTGERIQYMSRRHIADMYTGLMAPVGVAALGYLIVLILYTLLPKPTSPAIFDWSAAVAGMCLLWVIYNIIDWTNDYFVFTNQRVLFLERVILFYESRQESPLEAIQSVSTSTELFSRMMTFGNVAVRTYTGIIDFKHIEAPQMIVNLVENSIHQVKDRHVLEQSRKIEQAIRTRIQPGEHQPASREENAQEPSWTAYTKKEGFLVRLLNLKEVTPDTITYRTHWFILIAKTIAPFLLFLATLTALVFRLNGYLPALPLQTAGIAAAILCLVAWMWWIYEFVDWRNDVYIITPDQVVDINRKPLGHEERRAAPIRNIQTIEFKRVGIFGLLFNFGTVFIRVGDSELTFDYVPDPSAVQKDLFERFMQLSDQEKQERLEEESERMASWIEAYHRMVINKDNQQELPDEDQFSE